MPVVVDQMERSVSVPAHPRRIVSLVPSQTELLFDLGVEDRVVGVTRYCEFPERARQQCADIGGTKKFRFDAIDSLEPDLIIGNKEENYVEGIDRLAARHPVWMSDIADVDDALTMIDSVGGLVNRSSESSRCTREIRAGFDSLTAAEPLRAAYLIWRKPWMVAGQGTFIDDLMARSGLRNVFGDQPRYPEVSAAALALAGADVILLSSEPFPFEQVHIKEMRELAPAAYVEIVDGTLFSWYGSRLRLSPPYLQDLHARLRTKIT